MTTSRSLSNRQVARAAVLVVFGFLASGVLGLVRTAVFAAIFGTGAELDAFYTAQRIPELLFTLVAGGALGSSFIPVFSKFLAADDDESAWRLASAVMTLSALAALLLGLILIAAAPLYMPLLYQRTLYQDLAVRLAQIMMVTPVIFAVSGLLMGILNAHQQFFLPALAISMNNIGLIVGALFIAPLLAVAGGLFTYGSDGGTLAAVELMPELSPLLEYYAPKAANVYGLAIGAVLGAVLHLLVQLPGLWPYRAKLRPRFNWRIPGVMQVLRLMLPRVLGLGVAQLNFMVNAFFATGMVVGSLVALNTAWTLMFFALGVVAQSVGTAVFPTLSALAAAGDMDGYKDRLAGAMRGMLFLALPATVGLIVLGRPVITVMFERGAWTSESTDATAWALGFFAVGVAGHSLLELLSRAFYALSDTLTPVLIGVISLLANIVLSLVFITFIGEAGSLSRGPFAGLALANSLTTLLEGLTLWWLLRRRIGSIHDAQVLRVVVRALLASIGMGIVVWVAFQVLMGSHPIIIAGGGTLAGIVTYFGLTVILGVPEAKTIPNMVLSRIRR